MCDRSFDDLIRPKEQRPRNRQPERVRGSAVDEQLESGGLRDWKVGRLDALQDLVDVGGSVPVEFPRIRSVGDKTAASTTSRSPETSGRRFLSAELAISVR